jgi:hypothetical protein
VFGRAFVAATGVWPNAGRATPIAIAIATLTEAIFHESSDTLVTIFA